MSKVELPEGRVLRALTLVPEVRAVGEGDEKRKVITGYAVKWDQGWSERMTNWWGFEEAFERGAFSKSIAANDGNVYAAYQHDVRYTMGRYPNTLKLIEDEVGLRYEIDPPEWASWIIESIERGDVSGSSFIFDYQKYRWDESREPARLVVEEATLYEVSPVTSPAYPSSEASARSMEKLRQQCQTTVRRQKYKGQPS